MRMARFIYFTASFVFFILNSKTERLWWASRKLSFTSAALVNYSLAISS